MFARRGVVASVAVPPIAHFQIWISIGIAHDELAALLHPARKRVMHVRRQRLLPVVTQQQDAEVVEIICDGEVFQLRGRDRKTAFDQRHGEAVEVAQMGIARRRLAALEHQ